MLPLLVLLGLTGCGKGSANVEVSAAATTSPTTPPTSPPTSAATTTAPATTVPTTPAPTAPPAPDPLPPIAALAPLQVHLEKVVELAHPDGMAVRPGDPGLYVIGQLGQVWYVVDGQVRPDLVLDLQARTSVAEAASSETGLLGIAFSPVDGRMYLDFTDQDLSTVVASWVVVDGRADPATERQVLTHPQPGLGHKGGGLAFDPDGNLYIGFGDGGASNGRDARDMSRLLGKVARVRPVPDGPGYTIPADNPYLDQPAMRPEIFAIGMRNPWRLSYDAPTGDVWFGDVGNKTREEIDRVAAGQRGGDYGWYFMEGTVTKVSGGPPDTIPPVFEWRHPEEGVAAIGGYVYRGQATPALRGSYVFGDITGVVWFLGADGVVRHKLDGFGGLCSFGVDGAGEALRHQHLRRGRSPRGGVGGGERRDLALGGLGGRDEERAHVQQEVRHLPGRDQLTVEHLGQRLVDHGQGFTDHGVFPNLGHRSSCSARPVL